MAEDYNPQTPIILPYTVSQVSDGQSYIIVVPKINISVPRKNFYLGVGGYGYTTIHVEFFSNNRKVMKNITTWGGVIFLSNLEPGKYILKIRGEGKVLLALDLQNGWESINGTLNNPIAVILTPFEADGIHIELQTINENSNYILEIYNQSLDKIYSKKHSGPTSFDYYFPDSSEWNDITYIRIVPLSNISIKFYWYPLKSKGKFNYMQPIIMILLTVAIIFVIIGLFKRR